MSERYKKLYHLEHRLYASGAPILIESGALLLEQQSNALLCQLSFRNIQDRPVKSLRAVVQLLDARGKPLGKPVDHRYGDLDLKREELCGKDSALVLPSCPAASFTVRLSQVSLADGQVWTDDAEPWQPLPDQLPLDDGQVSPAEARRCRRRFGADCAGLPVAGEELWFCACGAVNADAEQRCHRCRRRRSAVLGSGGASRSPEDLEEASLRSWKEPEETPSRRRGGLVSAAAALVLLGLLALLLLPRFKPTLQAAVNSGMSQTVEKTVPESTPDPHREAYEAALQLQEKADYAPLEDAPSLYEQAAQAFEALGGYEDSANRAAQCREDLLDRQRTVLNGEYEDAAALLEEGSYIQARSAFLALGDYEDSAEQAREAVYRKALALYQYVDSHNVKGVTASLSMEEDEESLVALPREQLLLLGSTGTRELESCFGRDPVRFVAADPADESMDVMENAVSGLFSSLGDYRDSAELSLLLPEMIDRSDEFFALCRDGELTAAQEWLRAWNRPFEDRELWMERLELWLPLCRSWELVSGDPSLVPMIENKNEDAMDLRIRVSLDRDGAVVRCLYREGDETGPELVSELDDLRYPRSADGRQYLLQLNEGGSLCILLLDGEATVGAVEYAPAD